MKHIRHIFFDLDHTLWDFDRNSSETLRELFFEQQLDGHGIDIEDFLVIYKGINASYWNLYNHNKVTKEEIRTGRFKDTLNHFRFDNIERRAEDLGSQYIQRSPLKKNLFSGAHETLDYLKKSYQLHIITNGFREVQHTKLNNSGLTPYFNLVLCSDEVGVNKPNPLVFNTALQRTNASANESIMIGDNLEADILGAKNCGFETIFFNPNKSKKDVDTLEIQALNELIKLF